MFRKTVILLNMLGRLLLKSSIIVALSSRYIHLPAAPTQLF